MTDVHLGHGSDSFTSQRTSLVDYDLVNTLCRRNKTRKIKKERICTTLIITRPEKETRKSTTQSSFAIL